MRKNFLNLYALTFSALCIIFCFSCRKLDNPKPGTNPDEVQNDWNNLPNKLNVVYFVPNDNDTVASYQERLSEIMLMLQQYYAENLERAGFGWASFGLDLLTSDSVNIQLVTGKEGKVGYPYSGGGSKVINELDAYFDAFPDRKKSEHTLVIMPSSNDDPLDPGGVPFYGLGRYCFALDYPEMKVSHLGTSGPLADLATKWIGGLAHELGHGLNAPHNKELPSEQETLGTALMGAGNLTFGKSPTFITNSSAAIFANAQVFRNETRSDWYSAVNTDISSFRIRYEGGKIKLGGHFASDKEVTDVIVYHDPAPSGGGQDYDAITWTAKPVSQDSFYLESPLQEFYQLEGEYQLRVRLLHENGTQKTFSYQYVFEDQIPQVDHLNTKDLLDRSTWSVASVSSEEDTGLASRMLDANRSTEWHTQWKNATPAHPHHFVIDMGTPTTINGLAFGNRENLNGAIQDFEVLLSDDGADWTSAGTFSLAQEMNWQYIDLLEQAHTRFVKVVVQSSHGGFHYTHLAEFGAY